MEQYSAIVMDTAVNGVLEVRGERERKSAVASGNGLNFTLELSRYNYFSSFKFRCLHIKDLFANSSRLSPLRISSVTL